MILLHAGKPLHSWLCFRGYRCRSQGVFSKCTHTVLLPFKNREQVTQELLLDLIGIIIKQALGAYHYEGYLIANKS